MPSNQCRSIKLILSPTNKNRSTNQRTALSVSVYQSTGFFCLSLLPHFHLLPPQFYINLMCQRISHIIPFFVPPNESCCSLSPLIHPSVVVLWMQSSVLTRHSLSLFSWKPPMRILFCHFIIILLIINARPWASRVVQLNISTAFAYLLLMIITCKSIREQAHSHCAQDRRRARVQSTTKGTADISRLVSLCSIIPSA